MEICGKVRRASKLRTECAAVNFVSSFRSAGGQSSSGMRACSACAGDYEDPDRTAQDAESGYEVEGGQLEMGTEEFLAKN